MMAAVGGQGIPVAPLVLDDAERSKSWPRP